MSAFAEPSNCPFVNAFDDIVSTALQEYVTLSASIGGLVKTHSDMVIKAVTSQRQFLVVASMSQQPSPQVLMSLLKPTSDMIQLIQELREKNRASPEFNHLSTISESITALGWVTVSPTPGPFIKEMTDSGQFYSNKVLVAYKDKDAKHVEWAKSWISFLQELQKYVRQYHTTGLTWNPKGADSSKLANGNAASAGGPPPPPPPPPRDIFSEQNANAVEEARLALMKDLNMGTDITKSLKRVTADQQTHKNPSLRSQASHPVTSTGPRNVTPAAAAPAKPPKFELEGKKWMIEYQVGQKELIVNSSEMTQSVSIYKCRDSVVIVKGKVNSITLDSCSKTGIVFDDIVSVVELINCQSIQAQSMGVLPTINIEKTDVAQIYLSKKSLNAEVVTAKSSAVNISVPNNVGDYSEFPIPEQFKSKWTGKGFKTEPTDIAG